MLYNTNGDFSLDIKDDKVVKMSATDNSHLEDHTICIDNHMISSAIWDKSARVNFSKTNKIWANVLCSL